MLDAANESTGINYARRDASADRLWLAQRTKVNPWDRRAQGDPGEDKQQQQPPTDEQPAPPAPMIPQEDTLRLQSASAEEVANPFASLIEHQLHLRLPAQES